MERLSGRTRLDRALWVLAVVCVCMAARLLPKCGFLSATGAPCPLCGATRSAECLLRGDAAGAWAWNPWAIGWLALGAGIASTWAIESATGRPMSGTTWWRRVSWWLAIVLALATAAMWIARLTGLAFPWPEPH